MLRKAIYRVFLIISSIAALQILGTVILARNLGKTDVGLFRLVLTIAEIGSILSLLGIDSALVRFLSTPEAPFEKYNWRSFLNLFSFFSLCIALLISLLMGHIYKLNMPVTLSIFILIVIVASTIIFSALLRANHRYELSILFGRLNFIIFFSLLLALYFFKGISFNAAFAAYIAAAILSNLVIMHYSLRVLPCGTIPIPLSVLKSGLYYFGLSIAVVFIIQCGNLFVGKMLSFKDLAVFSIISATMRIFEFTQDSLYHVLVPYLNKKSRVSVTGIFVKISIIAIFIALVYLLFAKYIIHLFFKGLYDEGIYLVPLLICTGFVRTLSVLPASIIGGIGSDRILRNQFYLMILAAGINVCLIYTLIQKSGLWGVASANLITWCIIFLGSLLITRENIKI